MTLAQWIIRLNALFFSLYGLLFFFVPETLLFWVTGSAANTTSAMIDTRATYGGMSLAIGLLLFYFSMKLVYEKLGLVFVILIMGNMAFGRSLGILLDGNPNPVMWLFLVGELVTLIISAVLLTRGQLKSQLT
ncbi:DUF4345 domain-containing protein [Marinomonas sp. PE14-40]|uniref:DUF4345 domain-containing protein n=1 Tax=Marinomonas sp. PE14-40 TaxID=3060621 RepID=UPI003F6790EE